MSVKTDLERVTKQAYGMIAFAGMGDKLPNLCYYNSQEQFHKPYSEKTAELIDNEVKALIAEQYERAKRLLQQYRDGHHQLAALLKEREVIFAEDAERIFGKRPWASRSEEILDTTEEPKAATEPKSKKTEAKVEVAEEPVQTVPEPKEPAAGTLVPEPSSVLTESPEYTKPAKPKAERQRKPKEEGLFGGFDFEQEDTRENNP